MKRTIIISAAVLLTTGAVAPHAATPGVMPPSPALPASQFSHEDELWLSFVLGLAQDHIHQGNHAMAQHYLSLALTIAEGSYSADTAPSIASISHLPDWPEQGR